MQSLKRNMTKIFIRHVPFLFVVLSIFFSIVFVFPCIAESAKTPSKNLIIDRAVNVVRNGCFLIKDDQAVIASFNSEKLYIPASIWKIATASAALEILGPKYRFKTEFHQSSQGDLYIKGYGDPFLVSEEIDLIAAQLLLRLIIPIKNIYVDQSSFNLQEIAHGAGTTSNPYDAANFATSVNFNTVFIDISSSGKTSSAEKQTPTLPLMDELGHGLTPGKHRLNISDKITKVSRYVSELFHAKLFKNNENVKAEYQQIQTAPHDAKLIYTHYSSRNLLNIIEAMMLYSNNFIANQLFLTCGALKEGFPAEWQKSRVVLESYLINKVGISPNSFSVMEGSGLSRKNRITGNAMVKILDNFIPFANLLPLEDGVRIKSGTLTGVYSYAGFIQKNHKQLPFVIMLNQPNNKRDIILKYMIKALRLP